MVGFTRWPRCAVLARGGKRWSIHNQNRNGSQILMTRRLGWLAVQLDAGVYATEFLAALDIAVPEGPDRAG